MRLVFGKMLLFRMQVINDSDTSRLQMEQRILHRATQTAFIIA